MALLHLIRERFDTVDIQAVTVDHGLRAAAADEAQMVARVCGQLGVSHSILRWKNWDGQGNLQDQARRARYGLIANWAKTRGIETVCMGHTRDDQAETFLMRLARGSGVDGLSGMAPARVDAGILWRRPLLKATRQSLRVYLTEKNVEWVDDPTNEDVSFDRVKARKILQALAPLGIDAPRLAKTADDLRPARKALETQTCDAARAFAQVIDGNVSIERAGFLALPDDIRARLLAHALVWVSGADYRPRRAALMAGIDGLENGNSTTLHGCKIAVRAKTFVILREYQAVKNLVCGADQIWDGRWRCDTRHNKAQIRALGQDGLDQCPDWKSTGRRRAELLVSPSIWRGGSLISAPMVGFSNGSQIKLLKNADHFISSIISH